MRKTTYQTKNQKGKVLLIVHDLYKDNNELPLGPAYLAAVLKKHGADVRVCCQDVFHYSNEELAKRFLKNEDYDLIGIGFLAARFKETVLDLCETVNKYKKNAWLVLGGHGSTPIPEYILKKTNADIVAMGETEETITEVLDCKINNGDLSKIKGIAYCENKKVTINARREPIRNLDSIPFPEWSLFPMDKYTAPIDPAWDCDSDENNRVTGIITSRGCVNRCNFCYRMENSIRFRSMQNVIEEIKILKEKYGVTFFHIRDELFNASKERIFEFNKLLKENNLKIKFTCCARVDVLDEETANCLKESGCVRLNFGTESTDQNVLNLMHKNTTVEQNIRAIEITKKAGIGLRLNFLWGNKGDTEESLQNNVKFIKTYGTHQEIVINRPPTPYPGSELYNEAIEKGLLSGPEEFFNKFKNSDLLTINFTEIPEEKFYKLLFEANKELIIDYFEHTTKDINKANKLINDFYNLYFKKEINFRGVKHQTK